MKESRRVEKTAVEKEEVKMPGIWGNQGGNMW